MSRKIVVIHHSADFDGLFCREIAKRHWGNDAEYIGWDYGDPEPVVSDDTYLLMLDISVEGLMNHPRLNWVDHHKSAMEKYGKKPGYQIDGVAACRLAWQYFGWINSWSGSWIPTKQDFIDRKVSEPWAVRLAGEYDIWDKRDPDAELFQHGLRSCDLDDVWSQILVTESGFSPQNSTVVVRSLLDAGKAIQFAKTNENKETIISSGFDLDWEGLNFLACNAVRSNSLLFTAGVRPEHDALIRFNFDGKKWRISMYHAPGKERHDLSLIASKYGGGGHRGACGFECKTLPPFLA